MDFVIAGLALGSGLAILGFFMREAGLSRRFTVPRWFSDFGLVLMGAGVVVWCLTIASLVTDQEDSTALILIGAGAAISLVAGLILMAKASKSATPVPFPRVVEGNVRTSENPIEIPAETEPDEQPEPESDSEASETPDGSQGRERQDWEAVWRETWGSGEMPRSMEIRPLATVEESTSSLQTWSSDTGAEAEVNAEPEQGSPGGAVMVDEKSTDPTEDQTDDAQSKNGEVH